MPDEQSEDERKSAKRCPRPRTHRLRTARDFKACYDGARVGDNHLLLFATANTLNHPRLGVSVSKKHGNAVQRNRKKRRLREAFRLVQHALPNLDIVMIPRQGDTSSLQDYRHSLRMLAKKLRRRLD